MSPPSSPPPSPKVVTWRHITPRCTPLPCQPPSQSAIERINQPACRETARSRQFRVSRPRLMCCSRPRLPRCRTMSPPSSLRPSPKEGQFLSCGYVDLFVAWFVVTGDATPDGIRIVRSVLGAMSSLAVERGSRVAGRCLRPHCVDRPRRFSSACQLRSAPGATP